MNSIAYMATTTKEPVPDQVRQQEGAALRLIIKNSDSSQEQLAAQTGIGTKAYLSQLLSGHRPLNIEVATRLAKALGTGIEAFSPRLALLVREAFAYVSSAPGATSPVNIHSADIREARPTYWQNPATDAWPFDTITPHQFHQISPHGRMEIEAIARGMFMESKRQGTRANEPGKALGG
jgi:transcriptional regulator with XRE-family HTH domain